MNFSAAGGNVTGSRVDIDPFFVALSKNIVVLILGISINSLNATMIHTFIRHHTLRSNPRYFLFIHLVVNDVIQLTISLCLYIFAFALGTIPVFICLLVIIPAVISTYNTPLNLALMAIECYISVCFPLRYNHICTMRRAYAAVGVVWVVGLLPHLSDIIMLVVTKDRHFLLSRVFCEHNSVFSSKTSETRKQVVHIILLALVWFVLFYTYISILLTAKAASSDVTKARNTITLHGFQLLLCTMIFLHPFILLLIKNSFLEGVLPIGMLSIHFSLYVTIQIFPRFLSPVIYGFRDKTFRRYMRKYCVCVHSTKTKL